MLKESICVVLLTNDAFFDKMLHTLYGLITHNYTGDICIVIGNDLVNSNKLNHPLLKKTVIKHFPDINFTQTFLNDFYKIDRLPHWRAKIFQYHKFYLFDIFFKKWDYIFYLDSGITVLDSIIPILENTKENKFLAHSDSYPDYQKKLSCQFADNNELYNKLIQKYNLEIDYPQTTIMLYHTNIINEHTFNNLLNTAEEYSISKSNDQGIIALYFTCIQVCWEQIKLGNDTQWYYDYLLRPEKRNKPHILVKCL